jgi:hypothetical protein
MHMTGGDNKYRGLAWVLTVVLLAAALAIAIFLAIDARGDLARLRERNRSSYKLVEWLARVEYRIVPEPGISLLHLDRKRAQEWKLVLASNGSSGSDGDLGDYAEGFGFGELGIVDATGLATETGPAETVLRRIFEQLKAHDRALGASTSGATKA